MNRLMLIAAWLPAGLAALIVAIAVVTIAVHSPTPPLTP